MKRLCFALFLCPVCVLIAAPVSRLSLLGYSIEGREAWMYLRDTGSVERWVRVGDVFVGYRVAAWHAKNQTVTLLREGERLDLRCGHNPWRGENLPLWLVDLELAGREMEQLTVNAYQFFLEQSESQVRASDLVGEEKSLRYLESDLREYSTDLKFVLGRDGVEIWIDEQPAVAQMPAGPLVIQAGPTQSLSRISEQLRIPQEKLEELNPGLGQARFTEPRFVRLR